MLEETYLYDPQCTRKSRRLYGKTCFPVCPITCNPRSIPPAAYGCLRYSYNRDMRRSLLSYLLLFWSLSATGVLAETGFDLAGPKVDVHVKRGTLTLPISEVPNLLPDDRLWIHPDLPSTQSEHFVLVVAFLRGSTNPPPREWFTRVETWTQEAHDEGVFVTVPTGAQQAVLFLAPETGGDFNTLRKAVRQQPGTFVRAAQDLQAASWERLRLESYLSDVKITSRTDPTLLKARAERSARSLGIKIDENCFLRPLSQQASCLSRNSEGMVLDDANAESVVSQLANGSTLDLVNRLTVTPMGGGGMYSPYVGAIIDTAKILSSLHTAHFQYIPALALPTTDTLNLRLNMPPSFRNPKSVVVVALPPIGPGRPEPLYAVRPDEVFCAPKPGLVLPAEGAPLLFALSYGHNLVLHVEPALEEHAGSSAGTGVDVPITPDASEGGLIFTDEMPKLPGGPLIGTVRGKWGFDDWEGPTFHLYSPESRQWAVAAGDQSALVVGRDDTLHLIGKNAQCVSQVEAQTASGSTLNLDWNAPKPGSLLVKLPLKTAEPGPVSLHIHQYGLKQPDEIKLTAYAAAASLQDLDLNAGDSEAVLKGTRLDQVAGAKVHGIVMTPETLARVEDLDQLTLKAASSTGGLKPGKTYVAEVELKDGRRLKAPVTVAPPRPQIMLLSKGVQDVGNASPVQLGSAEDLPVGGRLVFFLKSTTPAAFPRDQKIELAAGDMSFHTMLKLSDGSLMLEDASTAEATLQPVERFGMSAFGPVRVRAVSADGQAGDWVPLGTLVRIPTFKELRCPRSTAKPCVLSGEHLFLAASVSNSQQFDTHTQVPLEFTGTDLIVPHSSNGQLYVKLRDDPATVQTITLPVTFLTPAEAKTVLPDDAPGTAIPVPVPAPAAEPAPQPGAQTAPDSGTVPPAGAAPAAGGNSGPAQGPATTTPPPAKPAPAASPSAAPSGTVAPAQAPAVKPQAAPPAPSGQSQPDSPQSDGAAKISPSGD